MTRKFFELTLFMALSFGFLFPASMQADEAQKREFRAAWIATVWGIDWPQTTGSSASAITTQKKELTDMLDKFQAINMNAVCFQVRSMCDAMYKSSYEPWSGYLTGTRGLDPGWDPLAFLVSECHKRGIECHVWLNPYRFSTGGNWTTDQDVALKNSGTLLSYTSGTTTTTILNPGLAASRERIVNVCKELVTNYDIDGIIFDDYFYPSGIPTSSSADDYSLWQSSGTTLSFANWRRANVNQMVKDVFDMVQATKPYVRFGIGPAGVAGTASTSASAHNVDPCPTGSDWQYSSIFSDPLAWLEQGTIDYISPQLYWKTTHSTNPFGPLTEWWSYVANHFGRHHYASHSISFLTGDGENTTTGWAEIAKQISYSRQYNKDNAPGCNFYSAKNISGPGVSGLGEYLHENMFQHPALTPCLAWKTKTTYSAPANLKYSAGTLTWTGVDKSLVKYSVYAIPSTITSIADASSSTFGGIKSDYLLGVTYDPNYTVPAAYQDGYWFAVCVLDGFGNEFEASSINLTQREKAPQTTLISPEEGASMSSDFSFTCTDVSADTYTLQIASDEAFTSVKYSSNKCTTSGANKVFAFPLSSITNGTYYWRVVTSKADCNDNASAVRTVKIAGTSTGSYESGYTIKKDVDTYADVNKVSLTSTWFRSINSSYNNITFDSNGLYNRGFVVKDGYLYVSGRSENSTNGTIYLRKYDATTGEHIDDIILGTDANVDYYPCNDVIKDSKGNVIVTNLTLNISTTPLMLFSVDLATGAVTQRASVTASEGLSTYRIDHCAVTGDITSGNFTIFAAIASNSNVVRWTYTNGALTNTEVCTLASTYPTSTNGMGIAPRIKAIDTSSFFVDGGSTYFSRYNFADGSMTGSFESNTGLAPLSSTTNGSTFFTNNGKKYVLYSYGSFESPNGHQFMLAQCDDNMTFTSFSKMWVFPTQGIGATDSKTWGAPCDYSTVTETNGKQISTDIYIYVPGNGIAAYRLTDNASSGISSVLPSKLNVTVANGNIYFGSKVDSAVLYNIAGMAVASTTDASMLNAGSSRGIYVLKCNVQGKIYINKMAVN
jgi:uncharacterized lipoprotein YddW (UPF0748 family)